MAKLTPAQRRYEKFKARKASEAKAEERGAKELARLARIREAQAKKDAPKAAPQKSPEQQRAERLASATKRRVRETQRAAAKYAAKAEQSKSAAPAPKPPALPKPTPAPKPDRAKTTAKVVPAVEAERLRKQLARVQAQREKGAAKSAAKIATLTQRAAEANAARKAHVAKAQEREAARKAVKDAKAAPVQRPEKSPRLKGPPKPGKRASAQGKAAPASSAGGGDHIPPALRWYHAQGLAGQRTPAAAMPSQKKAGMLAALRARFKNRTPLRERVSIQTGAKGGQYYVSSSGERIYLGNDKD